MHQPMKRLWLLFAQAVTLVLAIYLVVVAVSPSRRAGTVVNPAPALAPAMLPAPGTGTGAPTQSLRDPAQRAMASVVSINTERGRLQDPWQRFFGIEPEGQGAAGLGSGVIVSPEGYVLTNNHVVEGAQQIEVVLNDKRSTTARLVGTDPETDLAVLKIDLDRLPAITLGNSDELRVGDLVLAIGNPFGVGQTVTSGIVSAVGRNQLGINTFENFIQTDAAINPGNSGGALVDARGTLVGINTAIYSRSGGHMGIGFAIPVSTARMVLEGILKEGRVIRGWIGVQSIDLTPDVAQTLQTRAGSGVAITGVLQGGPAERAGIRAGDVVQEVAGRKIESTSEFLTAVAALKPGEPAAFRLQRRNDALEVQVVPGRRPVQAAPQLPR
jgi:Do/DeqQ family serine protease